jgi:hypothetical protein
LEPVAEREADHYNAEIVTSRSEFEADWLFLTMLNEVNDGMTGPRLFVVQVVGCKHFILQPSVFSSSPYRFDLV